MIESSVLEKIKPGATVRVFEKVSSGGASESGGGPGAKKKKEEEKKSERERESRFEGLVLARKHGSEPGATFTVRATIAGEGVEKVYPIFSPRIIKVEIINSPRKVHRAKLYYLRGRSAREVREKIG